uniref:Uncharacterized protein n=1 Tax=Ditylum brightwellii TaxID=49249 RepID=A0A6V2M1X7_9STRA
MMKCANTSCDKVVGFFLRKNMYAYITINLSLFFLIQTKCPPSLSVSSAENVSSDDKCGCEGLDVPRAAAAAGEVDEVVAAPVVVTSFRKRFAKKEPIRSPMLCGSVDSSVVVVVSC